MNASDERSPPVDKWSGLNGELSTYITEESEKTLKAYREQPILVDEHARQEEDTAFGGYAHRQLFELVQNGADALSPKQGDGEQARVSLERARGHIAIHLTKDHLYCADNGDPIDRDGAKALLFSHLSPKRRTSQIGTFGLGFKSVLGVSPMRQSSLAVPDRSDSTATARANAS